MTDPAPDWRDHRGERVARPEPPGPGEAPFYEQIGEFQGELYRRNAFAQGTGAEAAALLVHLDLRPGQRVLDVGCGDGRHLRALARSGIEGIGIDISGALVGAANRAAVADGVDHLVSFRREDARALPNDLGDFDAVMAVCQGGFGTGPAADVAVLAGVVDRLRPGGRLVLTAFHAAFAARHLVQGDAYDVGRGLHHQVAEVVGPDGEVRRYDLWTTAYTAREVRALVAGLGLHVTDIIGVEPGRYAGQGIALDDPELLAVARRP